MKKNVIVGSCLAAASVFVAGGLYYQQNAVTGAPVSIEEISTPIESVVSTPKPEVAEHATLETESVTADHAAAVGGDSTN